jgi:hypothetical protein
LRGARLAPPKRPPHPAPNVRDDRETPLFEGRGTGELVKAICPTTKAEYFLWRDWTTQIRLNWLVKFDFWRNIANAKFDPLTRVQAFVVRFT